jgi:hypothetical protein
LLGSRIARPETDVRIRVRTRGGGAPDRLGLNAHTLREALDAASHRALGELVDWLERPWARSDNGALRAR